MATATQIELTPRQRENAKLIYREGRRVGLSPKRARELVTAAWHESRLDENAVNKDSGAAGLFQLLSDGYVRTATRLGGLFDPVANTRAILPSYTRYWKARPNAPIGAGGRDVERSGKGAAWYAAGYEGFAWLDDTSAGATGARSSKPRAKFSDWLVVDKGVDVERVNPDLLARVWLYAAHTGKKIRIASGHRTDEEQVAIWNSGVRPAAMPKALGGKGSNHTPGQAVDAFFVDGEAVGTSERKRELARFGLKSLASIDDPQHLELVSRTPHDPGKAELAAAFAPAVAGALRALGPKIAGKLRGVIGRVGGGAAAGAAATGTKAALTAGGLLALNTDAGKRAVLTVLLAIAGLALALIGVLRLVGVNSRDVVNVALAREA